MSSKASSKKTQKNTPSMQYSSKDLTKEQMAEIRKSFKVIDTNSDGKISKDELVKAGKILGVRMTDEEANEMIKTADVDNDGQIGFEEYVNLMRDSYLSVDIECERYKACFAVIDKNQDGFISFEELVRALAMKRDKYNLNEVRELFGNADTDKDGTINLKEFVSSNLAELIFSDP